MADNKWVPLGGDNPTPEPTAPAPTAPAAPAAPTAPPTRFPKLQAPTGGGLVATTGTPRRGGLVRRFDPGLEPAVPTMILPGLPSQLQQPESKTFSADATLDAQILFYEDLTINSGVTVTGLAGGNVIFVRGTFTCNGTLSVNGLGGTGGAAQTAGNAGGARNASALGIPAPQIQQFMARASGSVGGNGADWPAVGASLTSTQVLACAIDMIVNGGRNATTQGPVGGGGGGGGATTGAAVSTAVANGITDTTSNTVAGGGGIGAGGSGGTGTGATGGAGGNGGGIIVVYCKTLSGSGTISANGANGSNGATDGGGGGGGGGGAVVVVYHEQVNDSTTLTATGGTGGTAGGGTGGAGGDGGDGFSGSSAKVKISVS